MFPSDHNARFLRSCPVTGTGKTTETIDDETYTYSEDDTVTWNVTVSATYVKRGVK